MRLYHNSDHDPARSLSPGPVGARAGSSVECVHRALELPARADVKRSHPRITPTLLVVCVCAYVWVSLVTRRKITCGGFF